MALMWKAMRKTGKRMSERGVEVPAPGKINLILRVLDRRPDGYHNLWSVMQTLALADTIILEEDSKKPGITLSCEGARLPLGAENLAYRAAELAMARLGGMAGIRLIIKKRLPLSAGLGGGSSDAAATILGIAVLFQLEWSRGEMAAMGGEIGSDVPFFFYGPTALVQGRGERVLPLELVGEGWLVVVNPGIPISTAWAYGKLAEARTRHVVETRPPLIQPSSSGEPAKIQWTSVIALAENSFGPIIEREYPLLRELRLKLLEFGAQTALLSGSGSSVFGVFPSEEHATAAAQGLAKREGWRIWITKTARRRAEARAVV